MTGRPRIGPLPEPERTEVQRDLLAPVLAGPGPKATNLYATLVRHPRLFHRWEALGGTLLFRGELPARHREILILRTARNTGSDYEWGQHVRLGTEAGLRAEEIERCAADGGWADDDEAGPLVAAADELHAGSTVGDATWERLAARYDDAQLIEIVAVVGYYHQAAFLLNALGVQREPGVVALPADQRGPGKPSPSGTG